MLRKIDDTANKLARIKRDLHEKRVSILNEKLSIADK
jgi:hypothetical protein